MANKPDIIIYSANEFYVYGKDLRLARYRAGLTRKTVCKKMGNLGFAYYPVKLMRYEQRVKLYLSSNELVSLISCLNGQFKVS